MAKRLNLGCGEFKKEGFLNIDYRADVGADIVHNLNDFPYPIDDDAFDRIEADHVLEHLEDPFQVMRELYRITESGGTISIRVPHFSRGFTHPEHKRGFDVSFPLYFDPMFKGGYQGIPLTVTSMKLTWFAQKYLKRQTLSPFQYTIGSFLGGVFSFLANLSPYLCSRIWCFWVGGFEEIHYEFLVQK